MRAKKDRRSLSDDTRLKTGNPTVCLGSFERGENSTYDELMVVAHNVKHTI